MSTGPIAKPKPKGVFLGENRYERKCSLRRFLL